MKKLQKKAKKFVGISLLSLALVAALPMAASAHCDTMEGPTIGDAQKAIKDNNVNYALKWVTPENEKEISNIFNQAMKVRTLNSDAQNLADNYFFENLVRIHRAAEGAPYTGVKPVGAPVDEKVAAADKSLEVGNLSALKGMVPEEKMPELEERFKKVMSLKDFDVNNVEAGREYIEAYVSYFKFAEGEEDGHGEAAGHGEEAKHGTAVSHDKEEENSAHQDNVPNPKTGAQSVLPYLALAATTGVGALGLGLKKRSK